MMTTGEKIHTWIMERLAEGRTVYATTYLVQIVIKPKHAAMVRLANGHCEIQRGKRWDSINGAKITAR
jgi:hypothetical protein